MISDAGQNLAGNVGGGYGGSFGGGFEKNIFIWSYLIEGPGSGVYGQPGFLGFNLAGSGGGSEFFIFLVKHNSNPAQYLIVH